MKVKVRRAGLLTLLVSGAAGATAAHGAAAGRRVGTPKLTTASDASSGQAVEALSRAVAASDASSGEAVEALSRAVAASDASVGEAAAASPAVAASDASVGEAAAASPAVAASDASVGEAAAASPALDDRELLPQSTADTSAPRTPAAPTPVRSAEIQYVIGLKQPVAYNAAAFAYKSRTDAAIKPWPSARKVERASFGLKLSYRQDLTPDLAVVPSVFYFLNDDIASDNVFDSAAPRSRLKSTTAGTLKGLTVDTAYTAASGESWRIYGLSGLGLVASTVMVDATLSDAVAGKTYKVASYTSYLYALTFDAGLKFAYSVGENLVITADALALVPVTTLAHGDSGYVDFRSGDFGVADYRLSALRAGVDHKTNGAGLSLAFGGGWRL